MPAALPLGRGSLPSQTRAQTPGKGPTAACSTSVWLFPLGGERNPGIPLSNARCVHTHGLPLLNLRTHSPASSLWLTSPTSAPASSLWLTSPTPALGSKAAHFLFLSSKEAHSVTMCQFQDRGFQKTHGILPSPTPGQGLSSSQS